VTAFWNFGKDLASRRSAFGELSRLSELARDCSGYKREAAVRHLGDLGEPDALGVLYERANDWVPQVRQAALRAIRQLMVPRNATAFVKSLPAAFHLANCGRADHRLLLDEISAFLSAQENVASLLHGLDSYDRRVRRICYDIAFARLGEMVDSISERAVRDPDPVVQLKGMVHATVLEPARMLSVLDHALRSPAARVRAPALRACLKQPESEVILTLARRYVLDRSGAVRDAARTWLQDRGHDVAAIFAQAMHEAGSPPSRVRAGILGIGELRRVDLLGEVLRLAWSPYPTVRAAVLATTVQLDPELAREMCERALDDRSHQVVRHAARLLGKMGIRPDVGQLLAMIRSDDGDFRIRVAVYLSRHSAKWDRLEFLLRMAGQSEVVPDLSGELSGWLRHFNRSAGDPSPEQLKVLRDLLDSHGSVVPPEMRRAILFGLG